jgi:hypothetical protein
MAPGSFQQSSRCRLRTKALYAMPLRRDGLKPSRTIRIFTPNADDTRSPSHIERANESGATILGARPVHSPSLAHYPEADREVERLATDLWGDMDGVTQNRHIFGKGSVFWELNVDEVLKSLKTRPDFAVSSSSETPPAWIHRQSNDTDIYFGANRANVPVQIEARFRVSDRHLEIFRPMDGSIDSSPYHEDALLDERTGNRQPGIQPAAFSM